MAHVTYTDLGGGSGQVVKEEDFSPEDWAYYIEHGNIVLQGGEHDPNILAARAAGEDYVDPRDAEIEELKAQLAAAKGESVKTEEPADTKPATPVDPALAAQAKVDAEQAK